MFHDNSSWKARLFIMQLIKTQIQSKDSKNTGDQQKRIYQSVKLDKRIELIQLIENEPISIKDAAERLCINYSTAKLILKTYKEKGQVLTQHMIKQQFTQSQIRTLQQNADSMGNMDMKAIFQDEKFLPPLNLAVDVMSHANQTEGGKMTVDTYKERNYSYSKRTGVSGISTREGPTSSQSQPDNDKSNKRLFGKRSFLSTADSNLSDVDPAFFSFEKYSSEILVNFESKTNPLKRQKLNQTNSVQKYF